MGVSPCFEFGRIVVVEVAVSSSLSQYVGVSKKAWRVTAAVDTDARNLPPIVDAARGFLQKQRRVRRNQGAEIGHHTALPTKSIIGEIAGQVSGSHDLPPIVSESESEK